MKKVFPLLLFLALLFFGTGSARAEMEIEARLNFDSGLEPNRWNVLAVTAVNNTEEDWQGQVEVTYYGSYLQEVFVASGSKAVATFYLPPLYRAGQFLGRRNASQAFQEDIEIALRDENNRVVKTETFRPGTRESQAIRIGVLASRADLFIRLANLMAKAEIVPLQKHHFDHFLLLEQLPLIIISDPGTLTFSAEQRESMARWVEAGGLLVLGGGRGWQNNLNLVPETLRPFAPAGAVEAAAAELNNQVFSLEEKEAAYMVTPGTASGSVLLASPRYPLLVARNHGRGKVLYSTLGLEDPPFNNAATFEAFWQYILSSHSDLLASTAESSLTIWQITDLLNYLTMGSSRKLEFSPPKIALWLLIYILLVGPATYFLLKKAKRWEWAWATIPLLALIFTGAAYGIGRSGRDTELVNYQVNLVHHYGTEAARVESFNALFIPRRGDLTLNLPYSFLAVDEGMLLAAGEEAGSKQVRLVNPPLWSLKKWYARKDMALAEGLLLEADLNGTSTVSVENNTGLSFLDSYVSIGSEWYKVGALKNGERKTTSQPAGLDFDLYSLLGRPVPGAGISYSYHFELQELAGFDPGLSFFGFIDGPLSQDQDEINTVALNLFWTREDLSRIQLPEEFNIPEGFLVPFVFRPDTSPPADPWYVPPHRRPFEGSGYFDLVFALPPGIDYSQGSYELFFRGEGSIYLSAYNYRTGQWEELGSLELPYQFRLELPRMEELVSGNRLQIRARYENYFWLEESSLIIKEGRLK